jgi:hypothetical protein
VCMCSAGDRGVLLLDGVTVLFFLDQYRPRMGIWYNGKSSLLSSLFAAWVKNRNIRSTKLYYGAC